MAAKKSKSKKKSLLPKGLNKNTRKMLGEVEGHLPPKKKK